MKEYAADYFARYGNQCKKINPRARVPRGCKGFQAESYQLFRRYSEVP